MRTCKRGFATLMIVFIIAGLAVSTMLFTDDQLHYHRGIMAQRSAYVSQMAQLQNLAIEQMPVICQQIPDGLPDNTTSYTLPISLSTASSNKSAVEISHFLRCRRYSLLATKPTKKFESYSTAVNEENIELFRHRFNQSYINEDTGQKVFLYWLDETTESLILSGDTNAVVIAKEPLKIEGKGRLRGVVISDYPVELEGVQLSYNKYVMDFIYREFSLWKLAERSWSDFDAENN
ncbi:DUF2572 family protein [[Mannheimia] succiniciproducens]|uniref:Uncharacterized protein n=1 Tax=Mannheimia succiniciproducens (strain KCTC 0769BP / MBEL55E) TaxID=221988 RepID=Q65UM7_MANSM|nr:DUF2572 family protein [[Mannheimia] succiniciproducens]AAU37333.1 unknown [[Mannheimia] succiniciproducens MBEL55E]